MHVDTGHNFDEVIEFRDRTVERLRRRAGRGLACRTRSTTAASARTTGPRATRNPLQTVTLLDAIAEHRSTPCSAAPAATRSGPAPRSASYSHRDEFGQWDPKNQRPELWGLYNARHHRGEHLRIFPLSNWTELDIWRFIAEREVDLPPLYFAHRPRGVPP